MIMLSYIEQKRELLESQDHSEGTRHLRPVTLKETTLLKILNSVLFVI